MDTNEFNEHFLNILNEKLFLEKNKEPLNLLRYNKDHNSINFLDQIYSCSLIPRIISPTRLSLQSKLRQYLFN